MFTYLLYILMCWFCTNALGLVLFQICPRMGNKHSNFVFTCSQKCISYIHHVILFEHQQLDGQLCVCAWVGVCVHGGGCMGVCVCVCIVYVCGVVGDGGSFCLHHKITIRIFQVVKATAGGISTICVTLATFVFKQVTVKVLPRKKTTTHTHKR